MRKHNCCCHKYRSWRIATEIFFRTTGFYNDLTAVSLLKVPSCRETCSWAPGSLSTACSSCWASIHRSRRSDHPGGGRLRVGKIQLGAQQMGKMWRTPQEEGGEIWWTPSSYGRCDGPTIGIGKNVVNTPGVVEIILWTPRSWRKEGEHKKAP